MRRRRWAAIGTAVVAVAAMAAAGARSTSLRASCRAAYRAFLDPALLDPRPALPPPPVDCSRFGGDAKVAPTQLELEFQPAPEDDLDDPEGSTMANLQLPDLRIPVTRRTMRFVRFFARNESGRSSFLTRFRRAGMYREPIENALREAGLPEDLVWLAAIESGFDPRAVSPAGAAGLWQFMPETGQLYGLDQSPWVDERRNIGRSTAAAVTHLRDLYERLRRWDLALAAYNAGYDRVVGAMDKVARARGPVRLDDRPIGFGDLAAARLLPEETANYVPQIVAFSIVAANLAHFNLDLPELPAVLDPAELPVPEGTRLRTIARAAGISLATLRDYNPQILRDRVPPEGGDYLIHIPAERVAHAIATFPSYLDQEVVASADADDVDEGIPRVPAVNGVDGDVDEPLPRRPISLGKNRLPAFLLPGEERVLTPASLVADPSILAVKLPTALSSMGIGWQQAYRDDPLGVFRDLVPASAAGAKGREAAIDKQLGFLDRPVVSAELLRTFTLANGIVVRVRRDPGANVASITTRIAMASEPPSRLSGAAQGGAGETLQSVSVPKSDVDAGIEIAASRLRLSLGDASNAALAEVRRVAAEPRRKLLASTPYGPAWITLSHTLFPPGHPLAGTVVGATSDPAGARDLLLASVMDRERARTRASLTVVGDIDEPRARKLAEAFLGSIALPSETPVLPHPREERISVEDAVPSPRALYGWIGPAEGEAGDASLRVALEILQNPKIARLSRALVQGHGASGGAEVSSPPASLAQAALEVGPRASVLAIEVAPAPTHDLAEVERRLDAELALLADEGPKANEVAIAKGFLRARLQKDLGAGRAAPSVPGMVHSAPTTQLRRLLHPDVAEKVIATVDEVSVGSVKGVIKRVLARGHRVVVTTLPVSKAVLAEREKSSDGR
jgi:membrane-bound lytic murein transglycosylase D